MTSKGNVCRYMFTVIVCTYKTDYETVRLTVDSIISQKFEKYELIITEDGSESDWIPLIEDYLKRKKFFDYKLRKNKVNVGTVKNYYAALKVAEGKYIKVLGAGDLLYNELALRKMYDFMEKKHCDFGFGKARLYYMNDNRMVKLEEYKAPRNMHLYRKKLWKLYSFIDIIVLHDWICGASIFGKREALIHYVGMLRGVSKYSEDIFQLFALLEKRNIYFLDEFIIGYEYGTGTSTKRGMNKMKRALIADINNSILFALKKYNDNKVYYFLLSMGQSKNSFGQNIVKYLFSKR